VGSQRRGKTGEDGPEGGVKFLGGGGASSEQYACRQHPKGYSVQKGTRGRKPGEELVVRGGKKLIDRETTETWAFAHHGLRGGGKFIKWNDSSEGLSREHERNKILACTQNFKSVSVLGWGTPKKSVSRVKRKGREKNGGVNEKVWWRREGGTQKRNLVSQFQKKKKKKKQKKKRRRGQGVATSDGAKWRRGWIREKFC